MFLSKGARDVDPPHLTAVLIIRTGTGSGPAREPCCVTLAAHMENVWKRNMFVFLWQVSNMQSVQLVLCNEAARG